MLNFNIARAPEPRNKIDQKRFWSNLGSWFRGPGNIQVQYLVLTFILTRAGNQEPRFPRKSLEPSWFLVPGLGRIEVQYLILNLNIARAPEPRTKIAPKSFLGNLGSGFPARVILKFSMKY